MAYFKTYLSLIRTIITCGWLGDFNLLRRRALKPMHPFSKFLYKCYVEKHQSYVPLYCDLADDVYFPHFTGIHIAGDVKVGRGCTIYQNVTLGSNYIQGTKRAGAPAIGDNVLLGAGVRIVGGVKVGNNVKVGAGCVVVDDVPEGATVVMEKPRVITSKK